MQNGGPMKDDDEGEDVAEDAYDKNDVEFFDANVT